MTDQEKRSRNMAAIRGKNTKPELSVRQYLHAEGFRFRLHRNDLPGKPDLVLPKYRLAVFVHGCFWHRHERCFYSSTPATRKEFWGEKFRKNTERDERNQEDLIKAGWRVLIIWECGIKCLRDDMHELFELICSDSIFMEWPSSPPRIR